MSEVDPDWAEEAPTGGEVQRPLTPTSSADMGGSENENDELGLLQRLQSYSSMLSLFLSPVAIILVSVWVRNEAMGGGGVSWSEGDAKRVFNWHPVLMIVAFR